MNWILCKNYQLSILSSPPAPTYDSFLVFHFLSTCPQSTKPPSSLLNRPFLRTLLTLPFRWVNDANFTYQTKLLPSISFPTGTSRAHLVFDGLDTIVSVYLNDKLILESEDMHISHRVDVTHLLSKENVLELRFKNAPEYAKKEMKRIGYKGNGTDVHFGGPERLFVRKAQYHWGWE
jgi:beta-galactosidase/beta-glucuronidase